MKYKIPNLKEILKPKWAHKVGCSFQGEKEVKLNLLEQGTTPKDTNLLKKLGIKKGEKILAIAAYYASWAKELQKTGTKVDYSDISKSIANWVKKNVKVKFGKYIVSNYELIPKKPKEYDWTFTYEACGGGRGLPLAYLRSLLNKKGGILLMCIELKHKKANAAKVKRYPNIAKILSKVYNTKYSVIKRRIRVHKRGEDIKIREFLICKIFTNNAARKKAELDLKVLEYIQDRKIIDLTKDSKKLKIDKQKLKSSFKRWNRLSKLHAEDFVKEMIVK